MKRKTIPTQRVLDLLNSTSVALSPAELQEMTKGECDRVTIYRILERLLEDRVIHKIIDPKGGVKYAKCQTCQHSSTHQHNHIHFSCDVCEKVKCIEDVHFHLGNLGKSEVKEVFLTVKGICEECVVR